MGVISFLINEVFVEASIFLGLVALLGLVLQGKKLVDIIDGTIKTILGVIILNEGVNVVLASLIPLTGELNTTFGVQAVMPDCFGPFGVVMQTLAREVSMTFILAFIIHLLIVKILPMKRFKNVFLTGHIMLFQSAWFVMAVRYTLNLKDYALIGASAVFTGMLWTILPAIARPYTEELVQEKYTLGHLNTLGTIIPAFIGSKIKNPKKSSEIELPGFLSAFSDYNLLLAVIMPIIYLILGLFIGQAGVETLSGGSNWILWLILNGITFAAGIIIVLYGVRMFLAAIVPAFKGISTKLIPGAVPALDDPVFYPFAPIAVIIGFLADFLASIIVTLILILIKSPIVVIPGPIFFFFDGALAGVFGDLKGGWKGAAIGGALMGVIVQVGTVFLVQFQPELLDSGLAFSGPDMVLLLPLFWLLKLVGGVF